MTFSILDYALCPLPCCFLSALLSVMISIDVPTPYLIDDVLSVIILSLCSLVMRETRNEKSGRLDESFPFL